MIVENDEDINSYMTKHNDNPSLNSTINHVRKNSHEITDKKEMEEIIF